LIVPWIIGLEATPVMSKKKWKTIVIIEANLSVQINERSIFRRKIVSKFSISFQFILLWMTWGWIRRGGKYHHHDRPPLLPPRKHPIFCKIQYLKSAMQEFTSAGHN
jgi:hypothetical protein